MEPETQHHHVSMKSPRSLGVVIKLGTSSIVDEKTHEPLLSNLTLIVETAVKLRKDGHKVIIVSSGAIGVGLQRMDVERRPKHISKLQALAAIGQCRLMSLWDSLFNHLRQPIAQILLTRSDISDRSRYLNAQNTIHELLDMGVIPIVNENDTLAVSEIKFGDNDTLSAITAAMVHADLLFLMTDVDCLYDKNPRTNPDAQPIEVVEDIGALVADVSQAGSSLGTGGMSTKIVAARLATSAGVTTVITRSSNPGNIHKIVRHIQGSRSPASLTTQVNHPSTASLASLNNNSDSVTGTSTPAVAVNPSSEQVPAVINRSQIPLHTRFLPSPSPVRDRYFWILHGLRPHGTLYIDQGAYKALLGKAGLLPVGVVDVEGFFAQQEAVRLCVVDKRRSTPGPDGKMWEGEAVEVGRCLTNYASAEIARIKGHQSVEIGQLLGYADSEYVAQRESVSFYNAVSRPASPVGGHRA
ncbi:glutamate 5-kinase [Neurospora tetrasperma FGSC 2508]|uniref:Glutamate 5-kinase n=1 Tax=Neurospora tetrasperma (strain FGSC 2508 / ATCC MYA-4615 / P0657) TaxID=510951 RepID=F8MMC7_NEUT8|nr:glutamate 5-kinase [Neurospora tetrasperma FGSC 2508]EGO57801.1 glutamate 5-kinase [Neurospora tetrasperma FGSC 2508]EGZ71927.1 glutamate 5-kinase [Neurospora tetrasperma FGSC 2509]